MYEKCIAYRCVARKEKEAWYIKKNLYAHVSYKVSFLFTNMPIEHIFKNSGAFFQHKNNFTYTFLYPIALHAKQHNCVGIIYCKYKNKYIVQALFRFNCVVYYYREKANQICFKSRRVYAHLYTYTLTYLIQYVMDWIP